MGTQSIPNPGSNMGAWSDSGEILRSAEKVTFSFGKNWSKYAEGVSEEDIAGAEKDILEWIGDVRGKRVIDVGSGSGIHSLAFHRLGAKSVHSFDYDPHSVETTKKLRERFGAPSNWTVEHGSALDSEYLASLGTFDIVYSWGVLHHTGFMWEAIDKVSSMVAPGGSFWITLYTKGPKYPKHLAQKQKYNASGTWGKRMMLAWRIFRFGMVRRARHFKNPFAWNQKRGRGMNAYHDFIDWLGGLPYEVASADEVVKFMRPRGFALDRIEVVGEGGCSKYVLSRL